MLGYADSVPWLNSLQKLIKHASSMATSKIKSLLQPDKEKNPKGDNVVFVISTRRKHCETLKYNYLKIRCPSSSDYT